MSSFRARKTYAVRWAWASTKWATGPLRLLPISRRHNQACRKACLVPPGRM